MAKEIKIDNLHNENSDLDELVSQELEVMQEFMDTKVDSINHTRKNLTECDDILSYL
jgi:hypothetical protein